jgi:predicted MFS family arabinose efflux permease
VAQDIVPAAATLAPPKPERGKAVGTVMTGLLLGILLSRVVSGFVAEHFGWRAMFIAAAASVALHGAWCWRRAAALCADHQPPLSGAAALAGHLWCNIRSCAAPRWRKGCWRSASRAFWSTLAVMLHGAPFHLGSAAAGAFGLAGAAGALAAPFAGRLADRRGPSWVCASPPASPWCRSLAMLLMPLLPVQGQLALLALATVGFDLGVQASLIAHQTIVYGIARRAQPPERGADDQHVHRHGGGLGARQRCCWRMGLDGRDGRTAAAALAVRLLPAPRKP